MVRMEDDDLIDDGMVEEMLAMTDDEDEEYPAEKTKGRGNDIDWFFLIQYETLELFNESAIMKELKSSYCLRETAKTLGSTK